MWGHVVLVVAALLCGGSDASAKPSTSTKSKAPVASAAPDVRSAAFFVMDAKTGAMLAGRDADSARLIASTSKVFIALVVRQRGLKLNDWTAITQGDADRAKGGARTRLYVDEQFSNHDLLRAMLIASDNRAPSALGRAVGLSEEQLIAAVNDYAKRLGLRNTHFTDTCGLNGNTSTPRDLAIALREALKDPVLAAIMTTQEVKVTSKAGKVVVYHNTNRSLGSSRYQVLGGKTGYTDLAGHCFVIAARIGGREVVMAFLGGFGKLTRFADFTRVATWLEQRKGLKGTSTAKAATVTHGQAAVSRASATRAPVKGDGGKRGPAARAAHTAPATRN